MSRSRSGWQVAALALGATSAMLLVLVFIGVVGMATNVLQREHRCTTSSTWWGT